MRCFPVTDYKNWWLPEGEEEIVIPATTQTTQNAVTGGSSEAEVSSGVRVRTKIRISPGIRVGLEVRVCPGIWVRTSSELRVSPIGKGQFRGQSWGQSQPGIRVSPSVSQSWGQSQPGVRVPR